MAEVEAPTWEALQAQAVRNGWYEGIPRPVPDLSITLCESHPFRRELEGICNQTEQARACTTDDVNETATVRNAWPHSTIPGMTVYLMQIGSRVEYRVTASNPRATMLLNTLNASLGWDLAAEEHALQKLQGLVAPHTYKMYRVCEMFLETSPRSGLTYLFRKLRPTLVLTPRSHGPLTRAVHEGVRILTTLCLHPLGYYNNSWGGCMVPTDDVIAHLLLLRGDEHEYWKRAAQHAPHTPEAGV